MQCSFLPVLFGNGLISYILHLLFVTQIIYILIKKELQLPGTKSFSVP